MLQGLHCFILLKASVIVSVYNKLEFLKLVIAGLETQTEKDFEVIISDDGSNESFQTGLRALIESSKLNISHQWHADKGFRKNRILNRSIVASRSDLLIFLDGDCIPHPRLVDDYVHTSRPGFCLNGRRVDLSEAITHLLSEERIRSGYLSKPSTFLSMLRQYLSGQLGHLSNGVYLPEGCVRQRLNKKYRGILGANFCVHKADLLKINGFDERYEEATFGEDTDIEFRLTLAGIKMQSMRHAAICWHCYHKPLQRPEGSKLLFEQVKKEGVMFTPFGINRIK
jgi:glycosyltransferase involved in cell wall biosynthesis